MYSGAEACLGLQGMVAGFLLRTDSYSVSHQVLEAEAAGHLSVECVSLLVVGFPFGFPV